MQALRGDDGRLGGVALVNSNSCALEGGVTDRQRPGRARGSKNIPTAAVLVGTVRSGYQLSLGREVLGWYHCCPDCLETQEPRTPSMCRLMGSASGALYKCQGSCEIGLDPHGPDMPGWWGV